MLTKRKPVQKQARLKSILGDLEAVDKKVIALMLDLDVQPNGEGKDRYMPLGLDINKLADLIQEMKNVVSDRLWRMKWKKYVAKTR